VVLTGDVHQHWAADLKADFDDPASSTLGSELVCTSATSGGDGLDAVNEVVLADSPHVKYNRNRRGYVRCQVDRTKWQADFKVLPYVKRPGAPVMVDRFFVIEPVVPTCSPSRRQCRCGSRHAF
jgi:alkaline phosphatase D